MPGTFQPFEETSAKSGWRFKNSVVTDELDDVFCAIENGMAVFAVAKVRFHTFAKAEFDFTFEVVRNLAPDLPAVNDDTVHQGLVFVQCPSPTDQVPS